MKVLCSPALVYLIFSIVAILVDIYYRFTNDAITKTITVIFITYLLNLLCKRGLESVSWFIVFMPFLTLFFIILTIIFIFGMNTNNYNYIKS